MDCIRAGPLRVFPEEFGDPASGLLKSFDIERHGPLFFLASGDSLI
jgi:hypothetical protein